MVAGRAGAVVILAVGVAEVAPVLELLPLVGRSACKSGWRLRRSVVGLEALAVVASQARLAPMEATLEVAGHVEGDLAVKAVAVALAAVEAVVTPSRSRSPVEQSS